MLVLTQLSVVQLAVVQQLSIAGSGQTLIIATCEACRSPLVPSKEATLDF